MAELKTENENSLAEMQEFVAFIKSLMNAINGKDEPLDLITVITNPPLEQLISSSNLSEKQAQGIRVMKWLASRREEFKPLGDYADKYLQVNHSVGGWAVNRGIALAEAFSPKLVNPNLVPGLEQKQEKKHFWQRSKPSQQGVKV